MANKMKFSDALRLSWTNIAEHKGRSAIIVLTISILFGVLMGVNFILRGLEVSLLGTATIKTDGKVYVENRPGFTMDGFVEGVQGRVDRYNGKVTGKLRTYEFLSAASMVVTDFQRIRVVDLSAVKDFITEDLSRVPEGKIPVLAPAGGFDIGYDGLEANFWRTEIAERYYVVGYLPVMVKPESRVWTSEIGVGNDYTPTLSGFNMLNLAMAGITPNVNSEMSPIIVDDGSSVVEHYIAEKTAIWKAAQQEQLEEWEMRDEPRVSESIMAVFGNALDLIGYAAIGSDSGININDFVSNSSDIAQVFRMNWMMLIALEVVILIVAVVIATFTFAHLIDQDAATIALYRSMGASIGDVHLIYFLYLLELCVMALVTSCLLGVVIVGVTAWLNAGVLAVKWQEFWVLDELPKVWLLGIDWHFWLVVAIILMVAPVSLIFAQGHFSSKNIAKQLKAD